MATKPRIILCCEGGIIQNIYANTEIEIINLDRDIFADTPPDKDDVYENRDISEDVYVLDKKAFAAKEKELKAEWDDIIEFLSKEPE